MKVIEEYRHVREGYKVKVSHKTQDKVYFFIVDPAIRAEPTFHDVSRATFDKVVEKGYLKRVA